MARFHFELPRLLARKPRYVRPLRPPRGAGDADDDADPGPAELVRGPGWFESSWELVRGLDVREGLPPNPTVNEWLTVALAERP